MTNNKNKINKKRSNIFKTFFYVLKFVFKFSPKLYITAQVLSALHAFTWVLATVLDQNFFDKITMFANHETSYKILITALCLLFLINVTNRFLNGIVNFFPRACYEKA